jgi:hypothetical protein
MRSVGFSLIFLFFFTLLFSDVMKVNKCDGSVDEFDIGPALNIYFEGAEENEVLKVLKIDQTTDVFNLADILKITFNPGNESKDQPSEIQALAEVSIKNLCNYPNPFNPSTHIRFNLENAGFVKVEIYNQNGQFVKSLVRKQLEAGAYEFFWDGRTENNSYVSTGYYFTRVDVANETKSQRMLLVK